MIAFFSNLYKNNPIQFFMMIAIIYLLLKQSNVIESFKPSNVDGTIDVTAISNVSQLAQKINKALDIDTAGNVTFKQNVNILPRGTIVAWNHTTAPAGWALCDGQNGTPDLRGRFIRMQNDHGGNNGAHWHYQIADIVTSDSRNKSIVGNSRGDQRTAMLRHKFNDRGGTDHMGLDTREMPSHNHTMPRKIKRWHRSFSGAAGSPYPLTSDNHGHNAPYIDHTNNTGSGWGHNNIPPYYVLSYIMRL